MNTRFSFEVQYPVPAEQAGKPAASRDAVMSTLQESLRKALAVQDSSATVAVSDSHKGEDNKLVELVSSLQDADIEKILSGFCSEHGLRITALE